MPNNRKKGLNWVNEVKKILIGKGYKVDGPFSKVMFVPGKMVPAHKDVFGVFDLIAYRDDEITGHQVTDLNNKSSHVKKMEEAKINGFLWCRVKKNDWRIWFVSFEHYGVRLEEVFEDNL